MVLVGAGARLVSGVSDRIPAVVAGLCDDAAVFPPGLASLPDAVRAYRDRDGTWFRGLVGPLVLAAAALPRLTRLVPAGAALPLAVTLPGGPADLPGVLTHVTGAVTLRAIEVAVPADATVSGFLAELDAALPADPAFDVYVEVPRDVRRDAVLAALAESEGRLRAKFRTGGVRADLHPDEAELAAALAAVVRSGVPFKATAGLHHALRNTDPETGFERHGFLNLLLATDALAHGGGEDEARALLAERDGAAVTELVTRLVPARVARTRAAFASFGTCSITEPRDELLDLGLLVAPVREGVHA